MRVALEIEHRVDDVLEHARAGDRALLGHVADEDHDDVALLGEPRQLRRAFAHLRDAARRGCQRLGVHGLDRVDDDDFGPQRAGSRDDRLELHLGQQLDRRVDEAEPLRAQRDLLDRFLAGDVQSALRVAPIAAIACSSSVDLPIPGSPPSRTTPPGTSPPPSTRSNSSMPGRRSAGCCVASTLARAAHRAGRAGDAPGSASPAAPRSVSTSVFQAPQCGHWPCHLRALAAAFGAAVDGLRLGHGSAASSQLVGRDDRGAELADDDAGRLVGDAHGARQVGAPAPSSTPSVAMTVSPAPETS